MDGKPKDALEKYAQAIECQPSHGVYKLYSNMSLAALTCGDISVAQDAALKAIDLAPADYTTVRAQSL